MPPLLAITDPQLQELSWTIAALITGIVLWATGGWILRPAVGAMGLALGGLVGWVIWQETGIGPPWAAPLAGGIVVACVALLAYRLLSGGLLAASLALMACMGTWAVSACTDAQVPHPPSIAMLGLGSPTEKDVQALEATITEVSLPPATSLADPGKWLEHEELTPFREAWQAVPPDPRLAIMIAAAVGALLGLILATFASTTAAVLLTACGGSLMMLAAGPRLLAMAGLLPGWTSNPSAGSGLAFGWMGLVVLGLIIQALARPRLASTTPPPTPTAS